MTDLYNSKVIIGTIFLMNYLMTYLPNHQNFDNSEVVEKIHIYQKINTYANKNNITKIYIYIYILENSKFQQIRNIYMEKLMKNRVF